VLAIPYNYYIVGLDDGSWSVILLVLLLKAPRHVRACVQGVAMMLTLTWSLSHAWHTAGPGDSFVHQLGQGQGPRVPPQVSWSVKYYYF
jgi:hypothetical protein